MPRATGPDRSLRDPQQSHVAEETGQTENSLSARSGCLDGYCALPRSGRWIRLQFAFAEQCKQSSLRWPRPEPWGRHDDRQR
jgi:hypothetical protein